MPARYRVDAALHVPTSARASWSATILSIDDSKGQFRPEAVIAPIARRSRALRAPHQPPGRRAVRSDDQPQGHSTDTPPTTAERRAGAGSMKISVLVAEDHPLVREGVIRALERDPGIDVIGEADNGLTAMELARELKPDVMVLDLRMPGLGGAVVLERLRSELPEIRALVMTANESPESLLDAVAAGAAGYLSKRTTGEELRQAVITTYGGGSVITPELAGHLLREFSGSARGEGSSVRPLLAARELEILRLVADGLTDNEIGKQLYISPRTVQNHLTRIREKTGLRRRSELARWAVEHAIA
jgi:DNA-binding NarL/FixJ family response regulator